MKNIIYCLLLLLVVSNARRVIIVGDGGSSGTRLSFYSDVCKKDDGSDVKAP